MTNIGWTLHAMHDFMVVSHEGLQMDESGYTKEWQTGHLELKIARNNASHQVLLRVYDGVEDTSSMQQVSKLNCAIRFKHKTITTIDGSIMGY